MLQQDGAKAAQMGDWSRVEQLFHASIDIQEGLQPTRWSLLYPAHGWRLAGLVEYTDSAFSFPDLCIEAYSLKKQGKIEEAGRIYAKLERANPLKGQVYFNLIAQ